MGVPERLPGLAEITLVSASSSSASSASDEVGWRSTRLRRHISNDTVGLLGEILTKEGMSQIRSVARDLCTQDEICACTAAP